MYKEYNRNYGEALDTLAEWQKKPSLNAFLKECEQNKQLTLSGNGGKLLRDFLIIPVQRVPRYGLLLRELEKNTPSDHVDYDQLTKAMATVQATALAINKDIHLYESRLKVAQVNQGSPHIKSLRCEIYPL
jgi:hypothetical protein